MYPLLFLLSVSYWYCLPVVTQKVVSYSEFRVYDFLLAFIILLAAGKYRRRFGRFFRDDLPGRWLLRFCVWATATYPVTVAVSLLHSRWEWSLVTLIFLFHLWGYVLAYGAFRIFVRTDAQCLRLLDGFLLVGAVEALIICLQGIGVVPRLWGPLYDVYGDKVYCATLGPNRAMPGHVMILVLTVAIVYFRNSLRVGTARTTLAIAAALVALLALGITGSRTSWVAFAAFCAVWFLLRRPNVPALAFASILVVSTVVFAPMSVKEKVSEIYQWKVTGKLSHVREDASPLEKFEAVDAGRYELWRDGLRTVIARPWLIPFGGGFNSYRFVVGEGASAHCIYITLVGELGVVGLYLYLRWLGALRREILLATKASRAAATNGCRPFVPEDMLALLYAIMVSLLGGEILYPYRPAFTFMGMFLFLCAIANHPALVRGWQRASQDRLFSLAATEPIADLGMGMRQAPTRTVL